MAKFLVTYHGSDSPTDPGVLEQAKAAFGKWLGEAGPAVLDPGAPLTVAARVAQAEPAAEAQIGGYSIVEAPTLEEAVALLQTHPYVGRGGTLQINEFVSL